MNKEKFQQPEVFDQQPSEIQSIILATQLPQPHEILISPLQRGGWSPDNKYLITAGGSDLFLRTYNQKDGAEKISREIDLIDYLKSEGFPVPRVLQSNIANPDRLNGENIWVLSEFIEGYSPDLPNNLSREELIEAGRTLASYHLIAVRYPKTNISEIQWHINTDQSRALLSKVAEVIQSKYEPDEIDQSVLEMLPIKLAKLNESDLPRINFDIAQQPKLQTHGDFHGGNLVFSPVHTVRAVLDWEDNNYWMRVAEVQAAICMTCKVESTEHFNTPIDFNKAKLFLEAYEELYPLAFKEKKLMPVIAKLDSLRLDFILYQRYILGSASFDWFFPTNPAFWSWWDAHSEEYEKMLLS